MLRFVKLSSASGSSVELHIVGYEFPAAKKANDWDANWLIIEGKVADADDRWSFRDPCLTTWDARDLLRWLRLAAVTTSCPPIDFTEPNLAVRADEATPGQVTLVFSFLAESAPPNTSEDVRWSRGQEVMISLPSEALTTAAAEWELELSAFPER